MKPARLRPQAREDRKDEVRYYRQQAGSEVAQRVVVASREALEQIEQHPGMGSLRWGQVAQVIGLRTWRVTGFPLVWLYFEREDHLDIVRLLGERQDILALLGDDSGTDA